MAHLTPVPDPVPPDETKSPEPVDKKAAKRNRNTHFLPTDRIAFPKQLDLLRAFALASTDGKGATNKDVGAIVRLSESTVSLSNPFFVEAGFLTRADGGAFVPAPELVDFSRTHQWTPETSAHKLAPAIERSWFGAAILRNARFNPVSEDHVQTELALMAGALPDQRPQVKLLIDYAQAAGLVRREGGFVVNARPVQVGPPAPEEPRPETDEPRTRGVNRGTTVASNFLADEGGVSFNVSVDVRMSEFAGWRPERIGAFFAGIAQVLAAKGRVEEDSGTGS